jgi:hypothetical protein
LSGKRREEVKKGRRKLVFSSPSSSLTSDCIGEGFPVTHSLSVFIIPLINVLGKYEEGSVHRCIVNGIGNRNLGKI